MSFPPTRAYRTRVRAVVELSPCLRRFTLSGEEVQHFGTRGLDQRIKLLLPLPDGSITDIGLFDDPTPSMSQWYRRWRELPDRLRNPMRTYTVRAVRPHAREIDIDFVLHGADGPASAWALGAGEGDELTVIGPDGRSEGYGGGIEWHPGSATSVLLAGDETALPAICAIVESLGPEITGHAHIEVPGSADVLEVGTASGVQVHWLPRDGAEHGSLLTGAVHQWGRARQAEVHAATASQEVFTEPDEDGILWEVPASARGEEYAWLAGEAGVITSLRRHLVRDLGMDRTSVAFMGYWRRGRAESA